MVATAALAAGAPAANAGVLVASAPDCSPQAVGKPFASFGDQTGYQLAPGGAFEAGDAEWQLGGGASVVAENESFNVHGADDSRSVKLPPGATATSPVMCVGIEHPTLPNGQWRPSPKLFVVANLLPLLPGEHTPVQFRVRSVGLGTWNVDDFYVDPKCR